MITLLLYNKMKYLGFVSENVHMSMNILFIGDNKL